MELALSPKSLVDLPGSIYPKNFEFILGDRSYHCSAIVAAFLSPRIARLHEVDSTLDSFELTTNDYSAEFQMFLSLAAGEKITVDAPSNTLLSIAHELENIELILLITDNYQAELTPDNVFLRLATKETIGMNCSDELQFLASHFEEFCDANLSILGIERLYQILSHPAFYISNEDFLYAFLSKLVKSDRDYLPLLDCVHFQFLSEASISNFIEDSCDFLCDLNLSLWRRICCRLLGQLPEAKRPSNRNSIRLYIFSLAFKTMCLEVDELSSIRQLKHEIQKRSAIPIANQQLHNGSVILADDKQFPNYGITSGTVLHLMVVSSPFFPIPIQTEQNRVFILQVTESVTIGEVKEMIERTHGLAANRQILLHRGQILGDQSRLGELCLGPDSALALKLGSLPFGIMVRGATPQTLSFEVSYEMEVGELCDLIEKRSGIPVSAQCLSMNGKIIERQKKIRDCFVVPGSSIVCSIR
jgi:hypothetical protein